MMMLHFFRELTTFVLKSGLKTKDIAAEVVLIRRIKTSVNKATG